MVPEPAHPLYPEPADETAAGAITQANAPFAADPTSAPETGGHSKRHDHAAAVANRMVERALWLLRLENQDAHVSDQTRQQLQDETTDMLLQWAYEVGEDSFRAGDFSSRPGAAGAARYPDGTARYPDGTASD